MIKPIQKNVLLKKENNKNSIIIMPEEHNDFYVVIAQGNEVVNELTSKKVIVKEGLIKVEYDGQDYFLCKEENILAVVEE